MSESQKAVDEMFGDLPAVESEEAPVKRGPGRPKKTEKLEAAEKKSQDVEAEAIKLEEEKIALLEAENRKRQEELQALRYRLHEKKSSGPNPGELMDYEIPRGIEVRINGKRYPHKGRATRGEVEQILGMASAKRQRLIREKISNEFEITQLEGGRIGSRLVKSVDADGFSVS